MWQDVLLLCRFSQNILYDGCHCAVQVDRGHHGSGIKHSKIPGPDVPVSGIILSLCQLWEALAKTVGIPGKVNWIFYQATSSVSKRRKVEESCEFDKACDP